MAVSPIVAQTLRESHGKRPLHEALALACAENDPEVLDEIIRLWIEKIVVMAPIRLNDH